MGAAAVKHGNEQRDNEKIQRIAGWILWQWGGIISKGLKAIQWGSIYNQSTLVGY